MIKAIASILCVAIVGCAPVSPPSDPPADPPAQSTNDPNEAPTAVDNVTGILPGWYAGELACREVDSSVPAVVAPIVTLWSLDESLSFNYQGLLSDPWNGHAPIDVGDSLLSPLAAGGVLSVTSIVSTPGRIMLDADLAFTLENGDVALGWEHWTITLRDDGALYRVKTAHVEWIEDMAPGIVATFVIDNECTAVLRRVQP